MWIDCEMTGLDPTKDTILSIACFITNASLDPLDEGGFEAVIHHSASVLASMNEWCINTHTASGLVDQCIASTTTAEIAASQLLAYIKGYVPNKGKALLAGNSVHADKMFLMQPPWNQNLNWLHYRILDVSAIKEGVRRWCQNDVLLGAPRKALKHTAREDILESIEEARYYQGLFGQMQEPVSVGILAETATQNDHEVTPPMTDAYGNGAPVNVQRQDSGLKRKVGEAGLDTNGRYLAFGPRAETYERADAEDFRTDVP